MSASPPLKKPTGVYLIAILFLLAPIGNILISFAGSGVANWYDIGVMIPFIKTIPALDWVWLGFLFITGLLLFRPHKLSWTLAIVSLLFVLGVNAFRLYSADANSIDPTFLKVFSVLAIICTLSVLVIAAYFRFPYLDRRTKWLSQEHTDDRRSDSRASKSDRRKDGREIAEEQKYLIRTSVVVSGAKATTDEISLQELLLTVLENTELKNYEYVSVHLPEISAIEVKAQVVERNNNSIRIQFLKLTDEFKQDFDRWINSRGKS